MGNQLRAHSACHESIMKRIAVIVRTIQHLVLDMCIDACRDPLYQLHIRCCRQ